MAGWVHLSTIFVESGFVESGAIRRCAGGMKPARRSGHAVTDHCHARAAA
jgi:hypothetical protein